MQFSYIPDSPYPQGIQIIANNPIVESVSLKHIHILINGKKMVSLHAIEKRESLNGLSVRITTNFSLKRQHIDSFHQKLPNL